MSVAIIIISTIAIIAILLAAIFMILYFTKTITCPPCPTGCSGSTGCAIGWPYPIIPKLPPNVKVGLPGIDFPVTIQGQTINSNGNYGLAAVDNQDNLLLANSKDQVSYSPWQIVNKLPPDYTMTIWYAYDSNYSVLPFVSDIPGGKNINWLTAQPGIALPMYPNMIIGINMTGPCKCSSDWISAPGVSFGVTIVIDIADVTMYTDYGNLSP